MKCPICGNEMVKGTVIIGSVSGGGFYPGKSEDTTSKPKSKLKLFFSSASPIRLSNVEQAWQCSECKKIVVIYCSE